MGGWSCNTRRCLVVVLLAVAAVTAVHAGPFEDAEAAHERGDYAQAQALLAPLLAQGDARAQYLMARMLGRGDGVAKDEARALVLTRQAAEQGHARAQYRLGMFFKFGWGVGKDDAESVRWLRRAAEQGEADAQDELGLALMIGSGAKENPAEALRWFRAAVAQRHARAHLHVGMAYLYAMGVPQDAGEAARWIRLGAEKGSASAQLYLANLLYDGKGVPRDQAEALTWLRRAAEGDDADAQFQLSMRFKHGEGAPRDLEEARRWARRAAESGQAQGQLAYSLLLVDADPVQAWSWAWIAAEQGLQPAWPVLLTMRGKLSTAQVDAARQASGALRSRLRSEGRVDMPQRERDPALVGLWRGEGAPEGGKLRRWVMRRDADGWFEIELEVGAPGAGAKAESGLWWTDGGVVYFAYGADSDAPQVYRYATAAERCLDLEAAEIRGLRPAVPRYRFRECPTGKAHDGET